MRIGILTSGGDCPGLNAVIRAIIRKGEGFYGHALVGYKYGWKGVLESDYIELSIDSSRGLLHRGGTILGTSRLSPTMIDDGADIVKKSLENNNIDCLIAIGGEGTLSGAASMSDSGINIVGVPKTIDNDISATDVTLSIVSGAASMSDSGINIVGVPKTIDNDISATDVTFGFHTAVQIATDAIDRLHTTAESHDRVMVVEVMGRHAGWIATYSGIAGGADAVLVPEIEFDLDQICEQIKRRHTRGSHFSIIVVAEGALPIEGTMKKINYDVDEYGHQRLGGIGYRVAREIEQRTGFETRETTLGHVLRGGTPTAFDRVLATRFGIAAIDAVNEKDYGKMVSLKGKEIKRVTLAEATIELNRVDLELLEIANIFQ